MPLFIGLSYSPECLPYRHRVSGRYWRAIELASIDDDEERQRFVPSVYRSDVSAFLKSYKRIHGLKNDKFTYFGCGEYGGKGDQYGLHRPHYHLIVFGDDFLYRLYDEDVHKAESWLAQFWGYGNVDINIAEWSGIHYVTKYCLKDQQNVPEGAHPVFTIMGKNIGNNWLKSMKAEKIRQQYLYLQYNKERIFRDIFSMLPTLDSDIYDKLDCYKKVRDYMRPIMPDFRVTLPSGKKAFLPRKLRRKVIGSFKSLADNPFILYQEICDLIDSYEFLLQHDSNDQYTVNQDQLKMHAYSILKRVKISHKSFV